MTGITYDTVVTELIQTIPELSDKYTTLLSQWDTDRPGPHVVYDLYVDHLAELAAQIGDPQVEERLTRAVGLLERLACSEDFAVQCLVDTSLVEALVDMRETLGKISKYMGAVTRVRIRKYCLQLGFDTDFLDEMGLL